MKYQDTAFQGYTIAGKAWSATATTSQLCPACCANYYGIGKKEHPAHQQGIYMPNTAALPIDVPPLRLACFLTYLTCCCNTTTPHVAGWLRSHQLILGYIPGFAAVLIEGRRTAGWVVCIASSYAVCWRGGSPLVSPSSTNLSRTRPNLEEEKKYLRWITEKRLRIGHNNYQDRRRIGKLGDGFVCFAPK